MTLDPESLHFDWDPAKDAKNLRKHGISFEFASLAFYAPYRCEIYDEGHSTVDPTDAEFTEHRHIIIGFIRDLPLYISYTVLQNGTYWLISGRKAKKYEVNKYYVKRKNN